MRRLTGGLNNSNNNNYNKQNASLASLLLLIFHFCCFQSPAPDERYTTPRIINLIIVMILTNQAGALAGFCLSLSPPSTLLEIAAALTCAGLARPIGRAQPIERAN